MVCLAALAGFFFHKELRHNCSDANALFSIPVPHNKNGLVPRLSLSGAGQLGFWETGVGGTMGEGWGK